MVGRLDIGPFNFDVTSKPKTVYNVEVLDDVGRAKVVETEFRDFEVVVDTPVIDLTLESHDYEVTLLNPFIDVTAIIAPITLTEYDLALLDLYGNYGSAGIAFDVFDKLDKLVRVELLEAGNGTIYE